MRVFIVVSHLNPDPMYKQVTDQIKAAIAGGQLEPESRLPSIREMARELKISAITVKRAYADLEHEGYIITRSGLGSYVTDANRDRFRREKLKEIKEDLKKILKTADRYGIPADEIAAVFTQLKGK